MNYLCANYVQIKKASGVKLSEALLLLLPLLGSNQGPSD